MFDCAYNFYKIIKSAYVMGLNEILLMEDDFKCEISPDEFNYAINNLPNDYDCVKLCYFVSAGYNSYYKTMNKIKTSNNPFIKLDQSDHVCTNTCFCLSRKGMKYYIDFMEKDFCPADVPFVDISDPNLNIYVYKTNISNQTFKSTLT